MLWGNMKCCFHLLLRQSVRSLSVTSSQAPGLPSGRGKLAWRRWNDWVRGVHFGNLVRREEEEEDDDDDEDNAARSSKIGWNYYYDLQFQGFGNNNKNAGKVRSYRNFNVSTY